MAVVDIWGKSEEQPNYMASDDTLLQCQSTKFCCGYYSELKRAPNFSTGIYQFSYSALYSSGTYNNCVSKSPSVHPFARQCGVIVPMASCLLRLFDEESPCVHVVTPRRALIEYRAERRWSCRRR